MPFVCISFLKQMCWFFRKKGFPIIVHSKWFLFTKVYVFLGYVNFWKQWKLIFRGYIFGSSIIFGWLLHFKIYFRDFLFGILYNIFIALFHSMVTKKKKKLCKNEPRVFSFADWYCGIYWSRSRTQIRVWSLNFWFRGITSNDATVSITPIMIPNLNHLLCNRSRYS